MKYNLIGNNDTANITKTVLNNRGITAWKDYLTLSKASRYTYKCLDNIYEATALFHAHFQKRNQIDILQDTDVDGVMSATIIYKMIKFLDDDYPVNIIIHKKNKAHGLESLDFDFSENVKLLIVPDAGSNDIVQHIELKNRGIDCICLDHHHVSADITKSPAIIVNNQISNNYTNKECCGASIAIEFCRCIDEFYWEEFTDELLDLCSVGNISDVMSLSSFETRAIVNEGLKNVNNKMLLQIIKAQDYSIKGVLSPFTVSFYVAPLINAFLRTATYDERVLLTRAFCEDESETFEYTKRGECWPTEETIYEHCVRLMKSFKSKQDRVRNKTVENILANTELYKNHKVAIVELPHEVDSAYTGVITIQISEKLNLPVLMVRETENGYEGSGRSFDYCPIKDFRQFAQNCPYALYGEGHPSAFGVGLSDIQGAQMWFDEQLKDTSFDKVYDVDFEVDAMDVNPGWCQEIENNRYIFAHGVEEPLWVIKNLLVSSANANIVGKNADVIQIFDSETGIKYVKFKCQSTDKLLNWLNSCNDGDQVYVDVVGTLGLNNYNNEISPQVIIGECAIIY